MESDEPDPIEPDSVPLDESDSDSGVAGEEERFDDEPGPELDDVTIPPELLEEGPSRSSSSQSKSRDDDIGIPEIPESEKGKEIDLTPFVKKLDASTRKILDEEYHAIFIHRIPPKSEIVEDENEAETEESAK